jgi:hypothetical protein
VTASSSPLVVPLVSPSFLNSTRESVLTLVCQLMVAPSVVMSWIWMLEIMGRETVVKE